MMIPRLLIVFPCLVVTAMADDGRNVQASSAFSLQVPTNKAHAQKAFLKELDDVQRRNLADKQQNSSRVPSKGDKKSSFLKKLLQRRWNPPPEQRWLQGGTVSPSMTPFPTAGPAPTRSPSAPSPPSPSPPSSGQTVYSVDYEARFQFLLDEKCEADASIIQVYCLGDVNITARSSFTIQCTEMQERNAGFLGYECVNTCSPRSSCENVYINDGDSQAQPYASINFRCYGTDPTDVDAAVLYVGTEGNTCRDTGSPDGRVFYMAQMGVLCAGEDDFNFFGDYYLECNLQSGQGIFQNAFTCFDGDNCGDEACIVDVPDVVLNVDVDRLGACIQTSDGSAVPPLDSVNLIPRDAGTYTSRFRSNWQLDLGTSCDSNDFPTITIECSNGVIGNPDPVYSSTQCSIVSSNTMQCQDTDATRFKDNYSGVSYNCTAQDALPTARTEYPATQVSCQFASDERLNMARLQMGVTCLDRDDSSTFVFYDDHVFECELGDEFDFEENQEYVCLSAVIHPGGSQELTIEETVMYSDYHWSNTETTNCYYYQSAQPTPTPPPSDRNIEPEEESESSSSAVGAIVGALVGVLVLVGIGIGVFCCCKRRNDDGGGGGGGGKPGNQQQQQPPHGYPQGGGGGGVQPNYPPQGGGYPQQAPPGGAYPPNYPQPQFAQVLQQPQGGQQPVYEKPSGAAPDNYGQPPAYPAPPPQQQRPPGHHPAGEESYVVDL